MEDTYGLHPTVADYPQPENLISPSDYHSLIMNSDATTFADSPRMPVFGSDELISVVSDAACSITPPVHPDEDTPSAVIKAKIASHPHYPRLVESYIDCYKALAPEEMGRILEDIRRESDVRMQEAGDALGADPELDEFMETYCDILEKYKSDLSRPFDEAKNFLGEIETQLRDLCNINGTSDRTTLSEEGAVSSDEECGEAEVDVDVGVGVDVHQKDELRDLKDQLLSKFGSHLSGLRLEFSKKKKKGKLPKEATQTLFEWWRAHYKWPYPTEADKNALAETTGLDQRQINNWFINQRKRHWKPSEDLQFALMDNVSRHYFTNDT